MIAVDKRAARLQSAQRNVTHAFVTRYRVTQRQADGRLNGQVRLDELRPTFNSTAAHMFVNKTHSDKQVMIKVQNLNAAVHYSYKFPIPFHHLRALCKQNGHSDQLLLSAFSGLMSPYMLN